MHGLAGAPLACALVLGALGGILWVYEHHFQRFTLWLLAASSACLVAGIPAWRDALAGLTTTGGGLTALGVLVILIGPAFHFSAVRTGKPSRAGNLLARSRRKKAAAKGGILALPGGAPKRNRYHRTLSPVVAIVAGTLFVVVLGAWRILAKNAGKSAAGTFHALVQSGAKINDGSAAAGVPASHRPGVIIAGVVILLLIIAAMRAHEKHKRGGRKGGTPARGGLPGLPAGRSS